MAVPDFQSFFAPLLELAGDGEEHSVRAAREVIANKMNLSETELSELLPSGTQRNSTTGWRGPRVILFRLRFSNPLGEGIFESLIEDASCWRKGIPASIFGSWTSTPSSLNFMPRTVIAIVKLLEKLLRHRQKHQKKSYRKHIKTFEMN